MNTSGTHKVSFADVVTILGPLSPGEHDAVRIAYSYALDKGRDPLEECRQALRLVWAAFKRDGSRAEQTVREARPARVRTAGSKAEKDHAKALADRIARFGNADPAVLEARKRLGLPAQGVTSRNALAFLREHTIEFVEEDARPPGRGKRGVIVDYPDRGGWTVTLAAPGSFLAKLQREAQQYAERTQFQPLWDSQLGSAVPACLWFILTGRVPPTPPVQVMRPPSSVDTITILVLARVASASTVAAAFSQMQKRILGRRKGRPFAPRSLDVVAFVEREVGGPADRLDQRSWGKLLKRWNATHRERFKHVQQMRLAYRRAAESLF